MPLRKRNEIATVISGKWTPSKTRQQGATNETAMLYPIVKYGAEGLTRPASRVTKFDADFETLCADMFESMYAAQGVGLAAPQIGKSMRLAVVDVTVGKKPEAKLGHVNPEMIH